MWLVRLSSVQPDLASAGPTHSIARTATTHSIGVYCEARPDLGCLNLAEQQVPPIVEEG